MEAEIKTPLGDELHQACQDGDLDTVLGYISHQQTSSYKPPFNEMLYTAIFEDNLNVAKYCLENGAPVTDNILKKILVCRAKNVYIFVLESKRINVNHYIPWFGDMLSNAVTDNDLEWARLCLEHNADPNCNLVDEYMSVLATAAEVTCIEMVKLLVEHGASVKGSGAIVMAAQEGKLDVVQYLLDRGADIDEIGIDHPQDPRYREVSKLRLWNPQIP